MLKTEEGGQSCNSDNCKQYCDKDRAFVTENSNVTVATVITASSIVTKIISPSGRPGINSCNSDNCKQYCDKIPVKLIKDLTACCNSDNCKQYCDVVAFTESTRDSKGCNSDN